MTPGELAALHGRCFPVHPRAWSADEFSDLLDNRLNFLLIRPQGFLLGRSVSDEAELLTLAVAPEARRMGLGRTLLAEFAHTSTARGGREAFLEVASDNAPAIALYASAGWQRAGTRRDYYAPGIDAMVMRREM